MPRVQLVSKMLGKELDDLSDIKGEQKADQKAESTEPLFETKDLCSDAGIKPFDFYIKRVRSTDLPDCWDPAEANVSVLFSVPTVSLAAQ